MLEIKTQVSKSQYFKLILNLFFLNKSFVVYLLVLLAVGIVTYLLQAVLVSAAAFILLFLMILAGIFQAYASAFLTKNEAIFQQVGYLIDEEGVTSKRDGKESKTLWDQFIQHKYIAGFYVLYISTVSFIIIPEADVPTEKRTYLSDLINDNIKTLKKDIEYYKNLNNR